MGVEIRIEGLTKRFGSQTIWEDVTFTLPAGEISVMLGPSGTGKSVLLKTLVGLLKPNAGHIWINGKDVPNLPERELYEVRKLFGVLFQDGALFGSMSLLDNICFPLREHTKKSESEIKRISLEKMELVGLLGSESKLPGEISGGMRKRAGLARALVLDPEIILFDEPDSGLDPVRTAYLNQLIVDLNAQIEATFLIVTHDIDTARNVPDNIGLLYRRHLAMFGPREMLLSSNEPVVLQFLNARRQGPIGMAEEKDSAELAAEQESQEEAPVLPPIPLQLLPTEGMTRRTMRPPGQWLRENNVTPPEGSAVAQKEVQAEAAQAMGLEPEEAYQDVPSDGDVGWDSNQEITGGVVSENASGGGYADDEDSDRNSRREGRDRRADDRGEGGRDGYERVDENGYAYDENGYAYDAAGYVYDEDGNIYSRDGWISLAGYEQDAYDGYGQDGHERDGHEQDGHEQDERNGHEQSRGAHTAVVDGVIVDLGEEQPQQDGRRRPRPWPVDANGGGRASRPGGRRPRPSPGPDGGADAGGSQRVGAVGRDGNMERSARGRRAGAGR